MAKRKKVPAVKTNDGIDNFVSRVGLNNNNSLSASIYTFNLMTKNRIQLEASYRGSWVVGVVVDAIAEDMTRAGINITTTEDEKDVKEFQAYINEKAIWTSLCENIKWGRLYGGSLAVIQIKGQKLDTPLRVDSIGKDQFEGLAVYDRWQLQPVLDQVIMSGPNIGLPVYYDLVTTASTQNPVAAAPSVPTNGQIRIHHSRVIRSIGIKLPFFQAIQEQFWGESVLERLWDRLIAFDSVTMSSANLIERANNRTIGVDKLREIIAAGGKAQQGLEKMFDMMRIFQTNEGLTLLDKEDTFTTTSYSFAGLSDLMLQYAQQLSGASGVPLVRFFGQSPAGLSATGESDIRLYYDNINAIQNAQLRDGLEKLLDVMWKSRFGKDAPEDLMFSFVPLWQMSAMDKATIAKTNTETVLAAEEKGIISRASAMKELRTMTGDTGLFSNITDEEVAEAEAEPTAPIPEEPDAAEEIVQNIDSKPTWLDKVKLWASKGK